MAGIAGLAFDKDGTLFDFRRTWGDWARRVLVHLAGHSGVPPERLGAAIGFDPRTGAYAPDSLVIAHTPPEIAAHLAPHLPGWDIAALVALFDDFAADVPLVEAVPLVPLFDALRARGLRIGLVTNDSAAAAGAHLAQAGLRGHFDFLAGFDSGHGMKPDPGPLLAFAAAAGLAPEQVAMVGDSRHDLIAGRAAGMRTIAVLTGIAEAAELAPHADVVLPDIGAIPAWLDAEAAA